MKISYVEFLKWSGESVLRSKIPRELCEHIVTMSEV